MHESEVKLKCLDIIYRETPEIDTRQAIKEANLLTEYVLQSCHGSQKNTEHKV